MIVLVQMIIYHNLLTQNAQYPNVGKFIHLMKTNNKDGNVTNVSQKTTSENDFIVQLTQI